MLTFVWVVLVLVGALFLELGCFCCGDNAVWPLTDSMDSRNGLPLARYYPSRLVKNEIRDRL